MLQDFVMYKVMVMMVVVEVWSWRQDRQSGNRSWRVDRKIREPADPLLRFHLGRDVRELLGHRVSEEERNQKFEWILMEKNMIYLINKLECLWQIYKSHEIPKTVI